MGTVEFRPTVLLRSETARRVDEEAVPDDLRVGDLITVWQHGVPVPMVDRKTHKAIPRSAQPFRVTKVER